MLKCSHLNKQEGTTKNQMTIHMLGGGVILCISHTPFILFPPQTSETQADVTKLRRSSPL